MDKSTVEIKTLTGTRCIYSQNASLQEKIDNGGESSKTEDAPQVPAEEGKSTASNRGDSTSNNSNLENIRKQLQVEKEKRVKAEKEAAEAK